MNKHMKQYKANTKNEFIGEIINIMYDVEGIKDESDQTHLIKIIGLKVPNEFEELDELEELEVLNIGDRVKVTIEKWQITSIQKVEESAPLE